jgi:hypothetical protein
MTVVAMADQAATIRLAIAVFDEPQRLETAVADLCAAGVTKEGICLAGLPSAFDAAKQRVAGRTAGDPTKALMGGHKQRVAGPKGDLELCATPGVLLRTLLASAAEGQRATTAMSRRGGSWLLPDLCSRLTGHWRQGAIALFVSANSHAAQHRWSRVLLRHSAHTVQTHEFTLLA